MRGAKYQALKWRPFDSRPGSGQAPIGSFHTRMGHIERRAHIYAALYWERVVSPQVRAHMMCAAGKALCDASQLALPTSDSLARQGGDSDRTRAAPHRPPLGKTCRRKALRNSSRGRSAFWVLQRSARASSHDTLGLSGELEREDTHNTAPSSCSRASLAGSCAVPGTVCVVLPLINQPQA